MRRFCSFSRESKPPGAQIAQPLVSGARLPVQAEGCDDHGIPVATDSPAVLVTLLIFAATYLVLAIG